MTGRDLAILAVMYVFVGFGVTSATTGCSPTARSRRRPGSARPRRPGLDVASRAPSSTGWPTTASTTPSPTRRATRTARTPTTARLARGARAAGGTPTWAGCSTATSARRARRFARDLREDPAIGFVDRCSSVWVAARPRAAVRRRARALGRQARRRADRARVGRPRADLPAAPRDLERQLDLPHVRRPAVRDRATRAATTGWSRSSRSARAGTTTTTRSRPRPSTACSPHQFDPSYAVIRLMQAVGLARRVVVPTR